MNQRYVRSIPNATTIPCRHTAIVHPQNNLLPFFRSALHTHPSGGRWSRVLYSMSALSTETCRFEYLVDGLTTLSEPPPWEESRAISAGTHDWTRTSIAVCESYPRPRVFFRLVWRPRSMTRLHGSLLCRIWDNTLCPIWLKSTLWH